MASTIGQRIRKLRMDLHLSQEELGKKVGLKKAAIHKYENGTVTNLKRSVIEKLAEALNTTPIYLMGWEDENPQENVDQINRYFVTDWPEIFFRRMEAINPGANVVETEKGTGIEWNGVITTFDKTTGTFYMDFSEKQEINQDETQLLEKYRAMDTHGRQAVNWIIDHEYQRIQAHVKEFIVEEEAATLYLPNVAYLDFKKSEWPTSAGKGTHLNDESMYLIKVRVDALPKDFKKSPDRYFGVTVDGESMEPRFRNGDILIVNREPVNVGEIGIFTLEGQGYVKQLGRGILHSLNADYKDIPLTEDIICNGKVVGVLDSSAIAEE